MTRTASNRLRDLLRLFEDLQALHEELLGVVGEKVALMKRADVDGMQRVGERERQLIEHINEREGFRRRLTELIGTELGIADAGGRRLTASELAGRLDEPYRDRVFSSVRSLRGVMLELSRVNRVAGMITREMLGHFDRIFESVRQTGRSSVGYAHDGGAVTEMNNKIVDAVG